MDTVLLGRLACPNCRGPFTVNAFKSNGSSLLEGTLGCISCNTVTPVCHGFPLFGETRLDTGELDEGWLASKSKEWFALSSYHDFMREKSSRGIRDQYALFQPFNESSRSLMALYHAFSETLAPGDVILDTWCRTGWQGEWLASLFPQQQVLSLWEGNRDVLGYTGYQHWLPEGKRRSNLNIVFTHPDRPLPLADNTVALLVGLDSIHRYAQSTYLPECMRVTKGDGVLFFPHIHLTNSEPNPFFERGCYQMSGREWQHILSRFCKEADRKSFIFSEIELFDAQDHFTVTSAPDTSHYNGAALIAPTAWSGRTVRTSSHDELSDEHYLVINPLLNICLSTATVAVTDETGHTPYREMLDRHPCYERRLEQRLGHDLSPLECEIIFYARAGYKLGDICREVSAENTRIHETVNRLSQRELLYPAAVSSAMAGLQHYSGHLSIPPEPAGHFSQLWASSAERYAQRPLLMDEDGDAYDFESISQLVGATALWLEGNFEPACRVLIASELCAEALVVVWACWLTGRVVVPVDHKVPESTLAHIMSVTSPAICLGQREGFIQLDSLAEGESRLFSDKISPYLEQEFRPSQQVSASELAAILFTSGSSGKPKGVCLSQGSLLYTGMQLASHYHWQSGDHLLSLGGLHTMSGLRNVAVASLYPGMTVVVPAPGMMYPQRLLGILSQCQITHFATVPALLTMIAGARELLASEPRPQHLRQIVTTGNSLAARTAELIGEWFDTEVLGYYGLTETGGICVAQPTQTIVAGDLGIPAGAIAQARDENGGVLGKGVAGELAIYSPGNAIGYLQADTPSSVRFVDGWVYTGDMVRLLEDGSYEYLGRSDDQVKNRSGELLYLQEIENVAREVACIEDCCGMESEQGIVLAVVPAPGVDEEQWRENVLSRLEELLGAGKLPDRLVGVSEMKRFTSGKTDKKSMMKLLQP